MLVADASGALPLPWLAQPLAEVLAGHRGHALLVQGSAGVGSLAFVLSLAQAWLCESAGGGGADGGGGGEAGREADREADREAGSEAGREGNRRRQPARPCGRCGSCHLVGTRLHPDLRVLMPEALRRLHEWPLADDKTEGEDSKRKPSQQIRIGEVRGLIDWSTRTSARGRGKVAVVFPAQALNLQAGNALLKTLEEPPQGTRLVLATADAAALLPTLRSRCQLQLLAAPPAAQAAAWLAEQGVAQPEVLLAACSGRPLDALALARAGIGAEVWAALPDAVAAGRSAALSGWPLPLALDALHKVCHDAMARRVAAPPRFFPQQAWARLDPAAVRSGPDAAGAAAPAFAALSAWLAELDRAARHDSHPWQEALLLEALVGQGASALKGAAAPLRADPGRGEQAGRFATLKR